MPSAADDEALARALQEEFRRDYEASLKRSRQPPPSAPPEELFVPPPSPTESDVQLARRLEQERRDAEMARRLSRDDARRSRRGTYTVGTPVSEAATVTATTTATPPRRSTGRPSSVHRSRAPAVGQSGRESTDSRRSSSGRGASGRGTSDVSRLTDARPTSTSRTGRSQSSQNSHPSTSRGRPRSVGPARDPIDPTMFPMVDSSTPPPLAMYPIDIDDPDDIELAMKMQQEERDAALATQMAREDQEAASRRVTLRETRRAERNPRRCTIRRVLGFVIPVAIVAALVVVFIMFVGGQGDMPGIPGILDNDPHNTGEVNAWKNDGNGLKLEVVNALQEQWSEAFTLAMDDWENGEPDALSLTRSSSEYDYNCDPIRGKMKVCNGDYGDTRWKGINQVLLTNGWIISSIAKMNEFYLGSASFDQRRYTMCHEIGHGFGLPHTDENFYNKDLGNCMDYTNNPSVNKSPDTGNYEVLLGLYGSATGRMLDTFDSNNDGEDVVNLPQNLLQRYAEAVTLLENGIDQKWTVLEESAYGRAVAIDLGNSFTLHVHMLYAD